MARRLNLLDQFIALAGPDRVTVVEPRNGWPSLIHVRLPDEVMLVALHVGAIHRTARDRDAKERRVQNPSKGRPIEAPVNSFPALIGMWEESGQQAFAGWDAEARMVKGTRQSIFTPLWVLEHAAINGWASHTNTAGELIIGFHPALLTTYLEARKARLILPQKEVGGIVQASGLILQDSESAERARKVSAALVRSARFSRDVIAAYGGACSMCGLGLELLQGAHIFPVSAPGSPDEVWSGIALCGNHHAAFDRHLIWVNPGSLALRLHPRLLSEEEGTNWQFVRTTYEVLKRPRRPSDWPRPEMFERRYELFAREYRWHRTAKSLTTK